MASYVGVFVHVCEVVRHVEEESVAIDAIAKLGRVIRIPSKNDGAVVIGIDRGF